VSFTVWLEWGSGRRPVRPSAELAARLEPRPPAPASDPRAFRPTELVVTAGLDTTCPKCGRARAGDERMCTLCGGLMRVEPLAMRASAPAAPAAPTAPRSAPASTSYDRVEAALAERERRERKSSRAAPWGYFALGLATAPVFAWTPILQYMGWFLSSLVHEMGHAGFAWLCGMPAIPAISPTGHAAAIHGEQNLVLVALVGGGLAYAAWRFLAGHARWIAMVLLALIYPAVALTSAKDLLFLFAGHAGELAFATMALWKALDGGFTASNLERALYGTVGWYLVGKNVILCVGLMTSANARVHYASNGSFGLTNDYIRAAEDVLGWRLESVALLMLFASVATIPAAFLLWRASRRASD